MSEFEIINKDSKNLIVCFGGMRLTMTGIQPFEFLNYLSSIYTNNCDLLFYIDKNMSLYHKGINGITNNIEETVVYLNSKINNHKYEKVIFMGVSAGGYASILFGSLCNVSNVVAFIPPTKLMNPVYKIHRNLKDIINNETKYTLFGDLSITDLKNCHHISHCYNIACFNNVTIIEKMGINLKKLRDNNVIKDTLDNILSPNILECQS
jgi:esterase/lipase